MESQTALSSSPAQLTSAPSAQPLAAWFTRLGTSGKVLGIAALFGMIATFLPAATISVELPTLKGLDKTAPHVSLNTSHSMMVLDDWRGKVELAGFVGALVLVVVLYPAGGLVRKPLCWAGVGAGALVALLSLWLLVAVLNMGSGINMGFMGSVKYTPGIGVFVTLLAGLAVTAGAFLKVREEKLI